MFRNKDASGVDTRVDIWIREFQLGCIQRQ
jgi:hypothetical protein